MAQLYKDNPHASEQISFCEMSHFEKEAVPVLLFSFPIFSQISDAHAQM